ncbi:ATP:ADP Antiporter (AAA) Family [Trachipleistophora hominis]|uniref:ADP,ATP carrier protein n=1 Tax=Trachipleistophora hominis TaxID=72359 RepID=L7JS26_TRAHO|nr:ATP:ADP Antiporter (AAA) Family [Trachipleistophora hominis]
MPNQNDLAHEIRTLTENEVEQQAVRRAGRFGIYRVSKVEDSKFWLMGGMFFCIAYIYSVIRELKDSFIIKRQLPASISFLKLIYVPPVSIAASALVQKCLIFSSNKRILSYVVACFGVYFLVYGVVVLPLQDTIESSNFNATDDFSDSKMAYKGLESVSAIVLTLNCWTSTLHFVASEVWGTMVLSLLFMSFSNDVCPFRQFIRFMPLFYVLSNVALMGSSITMLGYQHYNKLVDYSTKQMMLRIAFVIIAIFCLAILAFQIILERKILGRVLYTIEGEEQKRTKKVKLSFTEGIRLMFKSKLVLAICGIVLAYNIGTNMIESCYKSSLKIVSMATKQDTGNHVLLKSSIIQFITGLVVILLLISPFSRFIESRGWKIVGIIPPLIATAGFVGVFTLALFNTGRDGENIPPINMMLKSEVSDDTRRKFLQFEETVCLLAVACFKICKYAAFDIAKETLSMKIDKRYRARFKGIYDGVCGKLGKAGGALLLLVSNQLINTTDIRRSSFFYLMISLVIVSIWFYLINYLAGKYEESVKLRKNVDIDLFKGTKKMFSDDEDEPITAS